MANDVYGNGHYLLAGGWACMHYGWPGLCAVGGAFGAGALGVHRLYGR